MVQMEYIFHELHQESQHVLYQALAGSACLLSASIIYTSLSSSVYLIFAVLVWFMTFKSSGLPSLFS